MEGLKEILKSPPVLRQVEYDSGRPVIVTVDTSPIAIGWTVGQDDTDGKRFAIRFGARILTERQRAYPQVKRELLDGETLPFKTDQYEGRLQDIGIYLSTLKRQEGWMDKTFKDIRHQSYGYLLRDGFLWKRPKRNDGVPLRVIGDTETKNQILKEFHDTSWAGHRGIWATYNKIKE
jgi:hypothetical protein